MYRGYCVQFLHQCHLSGAGPLTYSTTLLSSQNGSYVATDIFQFPQLETVQVNYDSTAGSTYFISQTLPGFLRKQRRQAALQFHSEILHAET